MDSWKVLNEDADYEIMTDFPHHIRRVGSSKVLRFTVNKQSGYYNVGLNAKIYQLHRIIANNFIPNPEEKPYVDHINGDKLDYHIENLRWTTVSENNFNRHSYKGVPYEYADELLDDAWTIEQVGKWDFDGYYVNGPVVFKFDGVKYRKLVKYQAGRQWQVYMHDIDGVPHLVSKRQLETALREAYLEDFDLE